MSCHNCLCRDVCIFTFEPKQVDEDTMIIKGENKPCGHYKNEDTYIHKPCEIGTEVYFVNCHTYADGSYYVTGGEHYVAVGFSDEEIFIDDDFQKAFSVPRADIGEKIFFNKQEAIDKANWLNARE